MATPYVTIVVAETASTQDLAAAGLAGYGRPVLAVAHRQTGGRGRSGRVWWQARRGVAASLAFSAAHLTIAPTFPLEVAMEVRRALEPLAAVRLKWPNDLVTEAGKVGGILVERAGDRVVVGCGLNLWWPDPPEGAAALVDSDPGGAAGVTFSRAWADGLFHGTGSWDRAAYAAVCDTIGREITWDPGGRGVARGVGPAGGLVVETPGGEVVLRSGEVRTVRPAAGP
jgi:biotin-(acetyl-CoA carboxylase) ligase